MKNKKLITDLSKKFVFVCIEYFKQRIYLNWSELERVTLLKMINPSAYGPTPPAPPISTIYTPPGGGPPSSMAPPMSVQQQSQQQQQQQQMVSPTWPPTSTVTSAAPPQGQQTNLLNGNYQQQVGFIKQL